MSATATEPRTGRRRGPGPDRGLRALDNGPSTNGTGRPMPYDEVAERGLIGAMITPLRGVPAIEAAVAELVPDDFYVRPHADIVAAIFSLAAQNLTVDTVTVADQLRQQGLWADELALSFLQMIAEVPSISGAIDYVPIVASCARRRRFRAVGDTISHAALEGDEDALSRALEETHTIATSGRPALVFEDLGAVIRGEEPEILPTLLYRDDGQALLYPGLLHWVMGEPACGKTWFALLAARAAVESGQAAMYLDYEGSRRIIGHRLARLGATEHEVALIDYSRPTGDSTQVGLTAARRVRETSAAVVVIDGAAKAMALDGVDEDRAGEVLGWMQRIVWPLCEAGATVVVLDHVPKDKDGRGRWARGSGAKLGEVDGAAYNVKVGQPWSRSRAGYALVEVAKDREGVVGAIGDEAARLCLDPDGPYLQAELRTPPVKAAGTATDIRDVVLIVVNAHRGQELTQGQLEEEVRGHGSWRATTIRDTAEQLAAQGKIVLRRGARNACLYSSLEAPRQTSLDVPEEAS